MDRAGPFDDTDGPCLPRIIPTYGFPNLLTLSIPRFKAQLALLLAEEYLYDDCRDALGPNDGREMDHRLPTIYSGSMADYDHLKMRLCRDQTTKLPSAITRRLDAVDRAEAAVAQLRAAIEALRPLTHSAAMPESWNQPRTIDADKFPPGFPERLADLTDEAQTAVLEAKVMGASNAGRP
ncbi:MAG: hypothetical protein KGJ84_12110 [Elusimicrobia bacterium]|nr:hypothetical protein [Elusimicrobiota bacterium]